mgnify:CR=1 FL=1
MKIKFLFLSVFMLALWSCETDVYNPNQVYPEPYLDIDSGDADFSTYVAMGGSITAGFSDNSLFAAAQSNSYPNIMANIMSEAGGGQFTQPYVDDNVGGLNVAGEQFWPSRFYFDGAGPSPVSGNPSTEATNLVPGPYSNMAFPWANAISFVAPGAGSLEGLAAGLANPWYVRAASSNNATMIGDVLAQQPTFVTLVPGNDFASYGLFGASGLPLGPLELEGDTGMLTGVIGTIQALGASVPNGVITTLPDPTNTATFNSVAYNAIPLDDLTAGQLNAGLAVYNGGLLAAQAVGLLSADEVAQRTVTYSAGNNAILITDNDLTDLTVFGLPIPNWRQATADDKISLFAAPLLGQADPDNPLSIWGLSNGIPDFGVLTSSEIDEIQTKLATANAAISSSVPEGWALFDLAGLYNEVVTTGVFEGDFNMTGDLVFGGFFGLDGYHPTSRGSALIAKRMMEAIDATWGSNLSDVGLDIGDYPTNYPDGI